MSELSSVVKLERATPMTHPDKRHCTRTPYTPADVPVSTRGQQADNFSAAGFQGGDLKDCIAWTDILGSEDLLTLVLQHLSDYRACARLYLAWNAIGKMARKIDVEKFNHILFRFAVQLELNANVENLYRSYVQQREADADHFDVLTRWTFSLGLSLVSMPNTTFHFTDWYLLFENFRASKLRRTCSRGHAAFYMDGLNSRTGSTCFMTRTKDGVVAYFKGEEGREHMVKKIGNGTTATYEGLKGKEYMTKRECADGVVIYYEGERGSEHWVKKVANGITSTYKGEKGREYMTKQKFEDGTFFYYKGTRGKEEVCHRSYPGDEVQIVGGKTREERDREGWANAVFVG